MNEIIQSLYHRKSVRAYEDRPVPQEVKRELLAAAAQAPTAGCQQLYTILDITDQSIKDALAETCDISPSLPRRRWSSFSAPTASAGGMPTGRRDARPGGRGPVI